MDTNSAIRHLASVMRVLNILLTGLFFVFGLSYDVQAFSLVGPHAPWMTTNMFYSAQGGPMNINEGYRWNVPTVTYGFDPSFVATFGQDGIEAVEAAIAVINDLPPASEIDLTNYANTTTRLNPSAAAGHLRDLKSYALSQMMTQLGLASPSRYISTFRYLQFTDSTTNYLVIQRNFDPLTLQPTNVCNGKTYASNLIFFPSKDSGFVQNYINDPFGSRSAVADGPPGFGQFYSGLTFDDVGGLRFLLSQSNHAQELLPPGCTGVSNSWVDGVTHALDEPFHRLLFFKGPPRRYESCATNDAAGHNKTRLYF
jgi:hypothetical protein